MIKNRPAIRYDYSKIYIVVNGDRLDTIAMKFYNNPTLWTVIADANGLPTIDGLQPGMEIKIP